MRQTSFAEFHCSLSRALEVVGDWWSPLVLRDLYLGLSRFDELVEDLGISRNLLTDRLGTLVAGGVVERHRYLEHPPRDEYRLTPAGNELIPVLMALTAWGDRWTTPPGGAPLRYRHRTCEHDFTPTVSCSHCHAPVSVSDVTVRPGPGGRIAPGTAVVARRLAG